MRLLLVCAGLLFAGFALAQSASSDAAKTVTFKFIPGKNQFYSPYRGNDQGLTDLYAFIDQYRAIIRTGEMPVYVYGYCASLKTEAQNRAVVRIRSNRVKSEMITNKGLVEGNFRTTNHTTPYTAEDGTTVKDIVIVQFHFPQPPAPPVVQDPKPESEPKREPTPAPETVSPPQPEPEPTVVLTPTEKTFRIEVRTNLLYDALLVPTLGLEVPIGNWGIKLDGGYAYWGDEHGQVQKMLFANPEIRRYFLTNKRLYAGASANWGKYNIYKGMMGSTFFNHTGHQGRLWNAGLIAGYKLPLSAHFALDFNLGLGYSHFDYDRFDVVNQRREFKAKDQTKNIWGPTQAGVNLIWIIGNKQ